MRSQHRLSARIRVAQLAMRRDDDRESRTHVVRLLDLLAASTIRSEAIVDLFGVAG